jgi:ABC-type sugar transport system permease subunit
MLAPLLLLAGVFLLYPILRSFILSFYSTAAGIDSPRFVGFENYRFLLGDRAFWLALANTAAFAVAYLCLQIPLSLGLAVLLNSRRVRARRVLRFAFFSSYLAGNVFVAILFSQLLSPTGGIAGRLFGIEIGWLTDPRLAMLSVLIAALWLTTGLGMIFFLAALQSIDPHLHEAAAVDGAGRWSRFWHITLPGVRHVTGYLAVVGLIGALQLFELPYLLFQQSAGPGNAAMTVVMYLYVWAFGIGELGYASAIGWTLVLLAGCVCLLPSPMRRGWASEAG